MSSTASRLARLGASCLLAGWLAGAAAADEAEAQPEELPAADALEGGDLEADALEGAEADPTAPADAEPDAGPEPAEDDTGAIEEALLEAVEAEGDDAASEEAETDAEDPADAGDEAAAAEPADEVDEAPDYLPDEGGIEGFERSPSERDPEERAQMLFDQAHSHLQAGEVGDAARTLRRAVNLDPDHHQARYRYARVMVATGRPDHAREIVRAGMERAPGHVPMTRLYAALAAEAGDAGSAAAALERLGDRGAMSVEVRGQLAALYRRAGQYERAIEHYEALAEAEPQQGRWEAGRAIALEGQGDAAGALEAWRRTLEALYLSEELERYARARMLGLREQVDSQ